MYVINVLNELDDDLRDALLRRPFKAFQYAFQRIDKNKLNCFHWNALIKKAKAAQLVAVRSKQHLDIQALLSLEPNSFHTHVFRRPCYNLHPCLVLNRMDDPPALEEVFPGLKAPYLIEAKVDCEDARALDVLQSMGFRVVGCTLKMSVHKATLDMSHLQSYSRGQVASQSVRPAQAGELTRLQDLIAVSHVHSHFFAGTFPGRELGRTLFREWIARCLGSPAYTILVLEEARTIAGFVSFLRSDALRELAVGPIGVIDFLAVAPEHQGRGHGHRLLTAALSELVKDCNLLELRTALENFRAAQIYGKFGFRVVAADYMLHYSLD